MKNGFLTSFLKTTKLQIKHLYFLTFLLIGSINAENKKSASSLSISYGFSGTIYHNEYGTEANTINDICIGYNFHKIFTAGLIWSLDNTYPGYVANGRYIPGYGLLIGLRYNDTTQIRPFLNLKYVYSGHVREYKIENGVESDINMTIQRLSLEIGTRIAIYKGFGVKLAYNLFLYKAGDDFSKQFEKLLGITFYLDYTIKFW